MSLSQKNRFLCIDTPLGKDTLMIVGIKGREAISEGFRFDLDLISEDDAIVFKDIIGENVTVTMTLNQGQSDEKTRYINGIVASFQQGSPPGKMAEAGISAEYYRAVIVPWSWLLTRMTNCRIFQEKDVKEIVEQIFNDRGTFDFEWKLSEKGKYKKRTYCVQYRETDFNFISRLLEEEGIHYYFKHEDGKHTMVLADSAESDPPCKLHEKVKFHDGSTEMLTEDYITSLSRSLEITTTKHTLNDFNFESPNSSLLVETETNQEDNKGKGDRELYDYPGKYNEYSHGEHFGKVRMETHETGLTVIQGTSQCKGFGPGCHFQLEEYFRDDMNEKKFLLTSVEHEGTLGYEPFGIHSPPSYSNRFTCIPFDIPFRPVQKSRKPLIQGVQTAIVVGPSGEEIYPDKYGRVKVQFHWDREGANDEKSSCWVRVSQPWAGGGWGGMFIPHIGHEVIVDFEEGDPDRPIITGRVYHGNNMPADTLPDEKTKSVIRSWQDNDIVIEDKDGDKHIQIKQANGNEIILHETSPNIEIFQENGNRIVMTADGPNIDITQECGNEILMHAAEGIQIRDKYGNEVVLDAAAGFIRIASPSHNSYMELGKSVVTYTDSNGVKITRGNQEEEVYGNSKKLTIGHTREDFGGTKQSYNLAVTEEFFVGAKFSQMSGVEVKTNISKEISKNVLDRERKCKGNIKYDSQKAIELIGGSGNEGQLTLDKDGAWIGCKGSEIDVDAGSDISLRSKAKINLESKGDIYLKSKGTHHIKGKLVTPNIKDNG